VKVQLDGQSWHWDPDTIEVDDAIELKKASGLNFAPFLAGVFELDPVALRALVWFVRRRDGEHGLLIEGVRFRISDLRILSDPDEEEGEDSPPPQAAQGAARRRAPRTSTTSKAS
jgi:hypothetical protein